MAHPLDNPVWHALAAAPADLVVRMPHATRFVPAAAPFVGVEAHTSAAYADVAKLLGESTEARFFVAGAVDVPAGWRETLRRPIRQMVLSATATVSTASHVEVLTPADVPAMIELAERAKPGPFGARTPELGRYLGIRARGRLVAMTGERFTFPGYAEISAVATDAAFRGRGYARDLTLALAARIRAHAVSARVSGQSGWGRPVRVHRLRRPRNAAGGLVRARLNASACAEASAGHGAYDGPCP